MSVTDLFMLQQTLIAVLLIIVAVLIARLHRMIAKALQPRTEGNPEPKKEEKPKVKEKQSKPTPKPTPTPTLPIDPAPIETVTPKEGEEKPTLFEDEVRGETQKEKKK